MAINKRGRPRKDMPKKTDNISTKIKPEEIPPMENKPPEEVGISKEQVEAINKGIENGEQAKVEGKVLSMFPEGVFKAEEPKAEPVKENEVPKEPSAKEVKLDAQPFNLTMCIDTVSSLIIFFLFPSIDPSIIELTSAELKYYGELERKCGIKFEVNSPWFFAGALFMTYAGKVKTLLMLNRAMKESEAEEKAKQEIKDDKKAA